MDIVVGATSVTRYSTPREAAAAGSAVEARVLEVRSPGKKQGDPAEGQGERRSGRAAADPPNARVVVLLVPEGGRLPRDLATRGYKVFLRFVPC